MSDNKYSEFLTPGNAMLAMIDHQTGLMVGLGDEHPTVLKNNILGLVNTGWASNRAWYRCNVQVLRVLSTTRSTPTPVQTT